MPVFEIFPACAIHILLVENSKKRYHYRMLKVQVSKTLVFLLIFTIVSSFLAYGLIMKAYNDEFSVGDFSSGT
jgi:hypothetical protein